MLDAQGRLVQAQFGALDPTSSPTTAAGGSIRPRRVPGASARVTRFRYGAEGFLASITDPAGRTTELDDATRADG